MAGAACASAGLLLAVATPAPTTASPAVVDLAAVINAPAVTYAPAVTASAEAMVTFGLESAGPVTDGIAPDVVTARALSGAVTTIAVQREAFSVPVRGAVIASAFGHRVNPLAGYGSELHTGLDYAGACGTPVVAADDGTVVESGWHAFGGGERIVVDHGDGMKTSYNHLGRLDVSAGRPVARGSLLGAVGSTGNSTGCHLHFEVMVDDETVDPQPWL